MQATLVQKRTVLYLLLVLLTLNTTVWAQVYREETKDGTVTYTDKPKSDDAKRVEAPVRNVVPATVPKQRPAASEPDPSIPTRYEVSIVAPQHDTQVTAGQRELTVAVSTDPALHPTHQLQILDNGVAHIADGNSYTFENIFRGTHTIQAQVLNQNGRIIGSSQSISVHVFRPSVLLKPENSPSK